MSDTPRTDAAAFTLSDSDYDNGPFVTVGFARKLEGHISILRRALMHELEASMDADGAWIDRNGDYIKALNETDP